MNVVKLSVRELRRVGEAKIRQAVLLLHTDAGLISVNVTGPLSEPLGEALWSDAIRQFLRLAEFRRNPEKITLADDALGLIGVKP